MHVDKQLTFLEWLSEVDGRNAEMKRIKEILNTPILIRCHYGWSGERFENHYCPGIIRTTYV